MIPSTAKLVACAALLSLPAYAHPETEVAAPPSEPDSANSNVVDCPCAVHAAANPAATNTATTNTSTEAPDVTNSAQPAAVPCLAPTDVAGNAQQPVAQATPERSGDDVTQATASAEGETLLAAVSPRAGKVVWSLGMELGLQFSLMHRLDGDHHLDEDLLTRFHNVLSLPIGVAYQRLPAPDAPAGWHLMFSALDFGQFLTTTEMEDGSRFVRPSVLTPVRLGVHGGLLFGTPDVPFVVSAHVNLIPSLDMWTDRGYPDVPFHSNGTLLTVGLSAGLYVPFLDLN